MKTPRDSFREYLSAITAAVEKSDATEHTHRPALKTLLEALGNNIVATNEPKRILCGAPDFNISRDKIPLGHIETKDIGTNLDEIARGKGPHGEQFKRYCEGLPNWILTDYLEFRWFVGGEKRLTARIAELDPKGKVRLVSGGEENLTELLDAFLNEPALTVGTAKDLAHRMAGMARIIRHLIINSFEHETEKGWLHNWLSAFREVLIPDLDEEQFADMFAQTLAYGLFAARVHTLDYKEFSREMAAYNLPKTNPFLRKLFSEIAGVDMPETMNWAVDDIVELLKHADMGAILKYFGKGKGKEDPVVHFYETFLAAYDPKMREVRGVYYTPEPVVSYIVRSIDHLLKTRFNRPKGLADENTLILDPATGTATFLYFVIDEIYQKFAKQKGAWDSYVDKHLLNRIFGFELLMAPYAIAHLKVGIQLTDLGYSFRSDQRLGIYLTNTLEEAAKKSEQLFAGWIAEEANAAAKIKRDEPIMVVLGNPPYSVSSANKGKHIGHLMELYKVAVRGEQNIQPLSDDYIKFLRFAHDRIERTGYGVIGMITNHSYLSGLIHRGMREELSKAFDEIYILDLHGNTVTGESAPDGSLDQNVFDIKQGVAISLFVKSAKKNAETKVRHDELWGLQKDKYQYLMERDIATTNWRDLNAKSPQFYFVPKDLHWQTEYEKGHKITDVFPIYSSGVKTHRDNFVLDIDESPLRERIRAFRDKDLSDAQISEMFDLGSLNIAQARSTIREDPGWAQQFHRYLYRPLDTRFIFYHAAVIDRPRFEVLPQMLRENLSLCTMRQVVGDDFRHVLASNSLNDLNILTSHHVSQVTLPLYLYPAEAMPQGELHPETERRPNLSPAFLKALMEKLKLPETQPHGLPKGITPEDIFHYAYAVFHSPTYRTRYAEFLKIDFPRLPLTSGVKLFRALAAKGAELVGLHLIESPKLDQLVTGFPVKGDNVVEKVRYTDRDKRVWINKAQYFGGVPKNVWEFHIGGYQVCEKWLKDRKGRSLSYDDIQHYQKIAVALTETIRLMKEIDKLIPGWPIT